MRLVFGLVVLVVGCSSSNSGGLFGDVSAGGAVATATPRDGSESGGATFVSDCQKDTDCKGARICVAGACEDPSGSGGSGTGGAAAGGASATGGDPGSGGTIGSGGATNSGGATSYDCDKAVCGPPCVGSKGTRSFGLDNCNPFSFSNEVCKLGQCVPSLDGG